MKGYTRLIATFLLSLAVTQFVPQFYTYNNQSKKFIPFVGQRLSINIEFFGTIGKDPRCDRKSQPCLGQKRLRATREFLFISYLLFCFLCLSLSESRVILPHDLCQLALSKIFLSTRTMINYLLSWRRYDFFFFSYSRSKNKKKKTHTNFHCYPKSDSMIKYVLRIKIRGVFPFISE